MIEYLEQLVEDRKYREALNVAEQLIKQDNTPQDIVRIYVARASSHCMLNQFEAVLADSVAAQNLAKELGDWDSFGMICLFAGVSYCRLGPLDLALSHLYEYLAHLPEYDKAAGFEYNAWYNLGYVQVTLDQALEATVSLSNALTAAIRCGEQRYAHGVRQSLVDAYLRAGVLEPIPRLLVQCATFLRNHPEIRRHKMSWTYHMQLRGKYALAIGKPDRARALATRTLQKVNGEPEHEFLCHVILSRAASQAGCVTEALGHALAARTCAVLSRRTDLESEAAALVYSLAQDQTVAVALVDEHYTKWP